MNAYERLGTIIGEAVEDDLQRKGMLPLGEGGGMGAYQGGFYAGNPKADGYGAAGSGAVPGINTLFHFKNCML